MWAADCSCLPPLERCAVSRKAIAAVLARDDLAGGERLVAFSLASFAERDDCAWPGASIAAARAGLSRSRYLVVRDRLVASGVVVVESEASGRGRSSLPALPFVSAGPWWEGELNAELFEAVLSRTRRRGPARLLLATLAALADASGVVSGLTKEEVCGAAGIEDRTYRRARAELLECGELELVESGGGRGNTNVWQIRALPDAEAACTGLDHCRSSQTAHLRNGYAFAVERGSALECALDALERLLQHRARRAGTHGAGRRRDRGCRS